MNLPFPVICVLAAAAFTTFTAANPLNLLDFYRNEKAPWQLEEALSATGWLRGFNGTWISGDTFYFSSDNGLEQYNAATNQKSVFVPASFTAKYKTNSFTLSPDGKKILVRYNLKQVFRHSYIAQYDILDIATGVGKSIHDGEQLQYCQWAPNSDKVAYVHKNNVHIHYVDESKPQVELTSDGIVGKVYNGIPDWVYEEEVLSAGSAIWWSPDGNKITIGFFDDTKVETFKYFLYGESENPSYQYPEEVDLKYPKPSTPNPVVSLKVYDLLNVNKEPQLITAPIDLVSPDHILQHVTWSDNENMVIFWLNRRQNLGTAQICSSKGDCKEVTKFSEPNGWISLGAPNCKPSFCHFTYWIGNWYQIWKLDLQTGKNVQESLGEKITVQKFYGTNDKGDIFYQATLPDKPHVNQVFKNDECLSCHLEDVDGIKCQMASATFSKTFEHYSLTCTGPTPYYTKIFSFAKGEVKTWEDNALFRNEIYASRAFPNIKFLNVTLGDGSHGIAKLYLPPSLDFEKGTRKYPLIVMVYGGPNSVRVNSQFTVGWEAYLTTAREVIYAVVDGRGTGNKGKDLLFTVNNHLGTVEIQDQIGVTRSLIQNYKFIDETKTGIWGWSYGGYVTAMTMSKDDNHIFRCGVSVAPVTAWYYYDTIYTERYMGLPTKEDNLDNYIKGDISQDIRNFRTHKFMLIHGSGDDNVHIQHSLLLAKKLQYADIDFDEMTYTDENHSIGNALPHLYHTMDHFWGKCFR